MEDLGLSETIYSWRIVLTSTPFRAACKAVGVLAVCIFVACNLQHWIRLSAKISPLLAICVVILSVLLVGRIWKKYSSDVNATTIRMLLMLLYALRQFHVTFMTHSNDAEREDRVIQKSSQRKILRLVVLCLMVQECVEPAIPLLWLFAVSAFLFSEDVLQACCELCDDWQQRRDTNFNILSRPHAWTLLLSGLKICVIIFALFIQLIYLDSQSYFLITASYYALNQGFLEAQTTKFLETVELDIFEGLEQHYVKGLCALLSIIYAFVFMVWCLIKKRQLLMLVALYTNVYMGSRELLQSNVALALSEWATIALFEKASKQELTEHNDICAVCLCAMRSARKTPCAHYFHGHCLRRCLKQRRACPLCNTPFKV